MRKILPYLVIAVLIVALVVAFNSGLVGAQSENPITYIEIHDSFGPVFVWGSAGTPEPTPLPSPTPIAHIDPYPEAPECDEHSATQTHTLWDADFGCHYDHSHGVEPEELVAFFDKWGFSTDRLEADTLALSIQTPNENLNKHNGMRWFLYEVEDDGCVKADKGRFDKNGLDNCVVAFAVRLHDLGGVPAMTTKLHSMALYTYACIDAGNNVPDLNNCGWSYIEQINAFGNDERHELHAPYKQKFAVGFEGNGNFDPPYIGARDSETCIVARSRGTQCVSTWNSERKAINVPGVISLDYRNYDDWQGIYTNDPFRIELLGGAYNLSERHVYEVAVHVPGNGFVTASGQLAYCFYGDEAPCQGVGNYEFHNYPSGLSVYNANGNRPEGATFQDVDIYFNGETSGWLEFYHP